MQIGAAITKYPNQPRNPKYRDILANYTHDIGTPPAVARTYDNQPPTGMLTTHWQYRDANTHAGIDTIHHSFKGHPDTILRGKHDRAIEAALRAVTKPTRITYWHEPENDVERGQFTPQQFTDASLHIHQLAQHVGNRLVTCGPVFMDWTLNPRSKRDINQYRHGSSGTDLFRQSNFIGWDVYNAASFKGSWTEPGRVFQPVRAWHRDHPELPPPAIAETGTAADLNSPRRRGHWLAGAVHEARDMGAVELCVFDSDVGQFGYFLRMRRSASGDKWVPDPATARAWGDMVGCR